MGTIVISGTAVLVLFGFGNHIWWLAAVVVLFLGVVLVGLGLLLGGRSHTVELPRVPRPP